MGFNRQIFTPLAIRERHTHRTVAHCGLENVVLKSLSWKKHNIYSFESANENNYVWNKGIFKYLDFPFCLWHLISTNTLFGVTCSGRQHRYQAEESHVIISSSSSQEEATRAGTTISSFWSLWVKRAPTSCWMLPYYSRENSFFLAGADLVLQQPYNTFLLKLLLFHANCQQSTA